MITTTTETQRCAGKTEGWSLHQQCQHCQRKTVEGGARQAHFLPPVFVDNKCPMRRQS